MSSDGKKPPTSQGAETVPTGSTHRAVAGNVMTRLGPLPVGIVHRAGDPSDRPDWSMWSQMPTTTLREAVLLSLDIGPASDVKTPIAAPRLVREFQVRMRVAEAHLLRGAPFCLSGSATKNESTIVELGRFGAWSEELGWSLPPQFPVSHPRQDLGTAVWPWGTHDTKLLSQLAAAANRFWKNFDPSDITTAPSNEDVSSWLRERGVPSRVADVMAQILRADGLPTGRRPTR